MATKKAAGSAKTPVKAVAPTEVEADNTPKSKEARVKGPTLRIKALIDRVAEVTGGKKRDVKETVEATLAAIGDALAKGEDLNLPGFGRARIARTADRGGASMMTLKIRRATSDAKDDDGDAKVALADEGDDS